MINQNYYACFTRNVLRCFSIITISRRCKVQIFSSNFFFVQPKFSCTQCHFSHYSKFDNRRTCTLIPGDGPGIELAHSLQDIFFAAQIPIGFETTLLSGIDCNESAFDQAVSSIFRNRLCLKGILDTRSREAAPTLNIKLKKALGLYGKIVNAKSVPFFKTRHDNIDILICNEELHGNYSIIEFEVLKNVIACSKTVNHSIYKKFAERVFGYARGNFRKHIKFVHKGNIFKASDGLFLEACEEASKNFSNIECEKIIVDNCARQLVSIPDKFDAIILPNIYGDIITNIAAGLVGGRDYMTSVSFSDACTVFEPVCIESL